MNVSDKENDIEVARIWRSVHAFDMDWQIQWLNSSLDGVVCQGMVFVWEWFTWPGRPPLPRFDLLFLRDLQHVKEKNRLSCDQFIRLQLAGCYRKRFWLSAVFATLFYGLQRGSLEILENICHKFSGHIISTISVIWQQNSYQVYHGFGGCMVVMKGYT